MITTPGGTVVHACAFDECNIQWNEKFYIVIQKTIIYQTSEDSVVWLVCTSDSNSINAIKFEFSSFQVVENLTTKTYKPEVAMSFYKEDIRLDSRAEVKLGDNIQMIIRVTNNANDYFDISAKSCFASGITLIEDRCPVSDDLFNVFNATAVGYLSNTFSMFRPTSISGGPYEVVFTCILEVCLWNCDEYDCSSGETSSSSIRRKKRNADVRPADGQSNPSVVRGFTLTAVAEGEEIEVKNEKPSSDDLCVPVSVIATLAGMFVFVVGSSSAITSISYNYYCNYTKTILVMKSKKMGTTKRFSLNLNQCLKNL
ncbi:uncharacterized protein LOC132741146 [Ruditapes philippinarum]|uniref:uncharacterized protein LOC132741146 n=1 Tax=Ruditapes philippinarum TaxID=129788 RepID=UPI00295BD66F|nr:uncharacterized protein LOC132741146 [Ruditapes philippinarum]